VQTTSAVSVEAFALIGRIKEKFKRLFAPAARLLKGTRVTPNILTLLGLLVAIGAALMYAFRSLLLAVLLLLCSGFVDALDGALARLQETATPFGGFLDSLCDRYSDAFILLGILVGGLCSPLWGVLALVGSLLVSYARARAEAAGVSQLGVGLAERPERLVIIMVATILQYLSLLGVTLWLEYGVIIVALLAHITVVQRAISAYRSLSKLGEAPTPRRESADTS